MSDQDNESGADGKNDAESQATESEAEKESSKSEAPAKVKATNGGEPLSVKPAAAAAAGHGSPATAAHDHHDHGLAHTTPVLLLVGILAVLMVLTVLTVSVTSIDLGAQGNLVVAMVIATVKAALVVAFFMHLVWDKKLHLILFLSSVLFLVLFLSLSVNDRGEYERDIEAYTRATNAAAK